MPTSVADLESSFIHMYDNSLSFLTIYKTEEWNTTITC